MVPVGTFVVPATHPCLAGHFPGRPIVPGVVLLDEAAALILAGAPGQVVAGYGSVRFARPVLPGDVVTVSHAAGAFACAVDGETVVRGTLMLAPAGAPAGAPA